jgi:hypothetical protein
MLTHNKNRISQIMPFYILKANYWIISNYAKFNLA